MSIFKYENLFRIILDTLFELIGLGIGLEIDCITVYGKIEMQKKGSKSA